MRKIIKISITIFFAIIAVFAVAAILLIFLFPKNHYDIIKRRADECGIDPDLVLAVIKAESNFDADAVSPKGAIGLMQVMPSTALWLSEQQELEHFTADKLYEPETNILLGVKYLSYLTDKFKDTKTALAAYNAGEGNVTAWLNNPEYSDDGKTLKKIPYKETERYVKKVTLYKFIYDNLR